MGRIKTCRQCGVPLGVGKDVTWHENGVITQAKDPDHRLIFYESDSLDDLFKGIEELIGIPIEHIVIESKRRVTRDYVEKQVPPFVRKVLHRYGPNILSNRIRLMAIDYGYGDIKLADIRNKGDDDDFQAISIRHPYSLPLFCGDSVGTKEAMDGRDFKVSWEQVGDHDFLITSRVGKHPIELQEWLDKKEYEFKPGDLKYKRCASCGVPLGVARCRWNLEEGTILDPGTGRRMAVFSPNSIEVILKDLESELGESVPEAVIEAQRRFVRNILGREEAFVNQPGYREMAGLRGLGYLRKVDIEDKRCTTVIENACLPLFMVGTVKGLFEMVTENESADHSWELLPDGDLVVELEA